MTAMRHIRSRWLLAGLAGALLAAACSGPGDPVADMIRDLERYPEYSLIVDDLRVESGFFPEYYMRFEVVTASGKRLASGDTLVYDHRQTDWLQVPEQVFARYENYLGMVVAARTLDGQRTGPGQAHPPGYQYVGNPRYGRWDSGGFWQFYGQYAFLRTMLGGWDIGRADYGNYRRSQERGRPYYGPVKDGKATFGTRGTATRAARPTFYQRYKQRMAAGGRGFTSRTAANRTRRSTSSWGRRTSRFGK